MGILSLDYYMKPELLIIVPNCDFLMIYMITVIQSCLS